MELRQLEHFVAVAELGSMTRAAERLHMVQSSLSGSIQALERTLGTPLLVRGSRGTSLTPAGEVLLPRARATLEGVRAARDAVARAGGTTVGTVRVATVPLAAPVDLVGALGTFRERYPQVRVHVTQQGSTAVRAAVLDGTCDWGVGPPGGERGLVFAPLLRSPVVVLLPRGHRLAGRAGGGGRAGLTPADLADEQLVHLPRSWRIRELVDGWLGGAGATSAAGLEVDDWSSLLRVVAAGLGVGYSTRGYFDPAQHPGVRALALADAPVLEGGVLTRQDHPLAAAPQALLETFVRHVAAGVRSRTGAAAPPV